VSRHAALVRSRDGVRFEHLPTPIPRPGELLLAPIVAGICGTDLQILRGLRSDPTDVLGHEGIATVVAAGPGGGPYEPSAVVTVNPTHPADARFLLGHNVRGFWAQRVLIPAEAVAARLVLELPRVPEVELASLIEPLASVLYGREIAMAAASELPKVLLVWGDGTIGHLAARYWRHRDPGVVVVHVHHTEAGLAWSRTQAGPEISFRCGDPEVMDLLGTAKDSLAAVVATPRTATASVIASIIDHCDAALYVDVHAGSDRDPITTRHGAIAVGPVRAANCGGQPAQPIFRTFPRANAGPLTVFGHRGVANRHLIEAVDELLRYPELYRPLVTHVVDIAEAEAMLARLANGTSRRFASRRVVKAAITIRPDWQP
jgi:threonine dehydrogenase-like Zn-dependent dehydrogenase